MDLDGVRKSKHSAAIASTSNVIFGIEGVFTEPKLKSGQDTTLW